LLILRYNILEKENIEERFTALGFYPTRVNMKKNLTKS